MRVTWNEPAYDGACGPFGYEVSLNGGTPWSSPTSDDFMSFYPLTIGDDCTVGHSAIVHACTVEDGCLIGMGSILLDGVIVGRGSLVGAGALVTPGTIIPPGSLVLGSPAKVKREINAKERAQILYGAHHYVELARRYLAGAT